LLRDSRRGDDVFMPTNPAFLLLVVGWIARWKRLRLFILVHDVFPENAVAAGLLQKGSILLTILRNLFNRAYSMCDTLIVIGRDMEQVIRQKLKHQKAQPFITVIENWSDIEDIVVLDNANNNLREELEISNKIVFGYTGNLGRVQGLMSLLDVIHCVKNTSLHTLFIGGGAMKPEMQHYIADNGITNVSMIGQMPRTEQNNFLSACDVGIVTLADNMLGLGVPSKSYNIMAAGRPILYIGNKTSEIALMISEAGNGWIFEPSDREGLISFFESLDHSFAAECIEKGKISRELAETRYARKIILHKFQSLFQ
jgi:glycosyltransferase involved in cell wall biosynthesis